jgi:hypothetical protein
VHSRRRNSRFRRQTLAMGSISPVPYNLLCLIRFTTQADKCILDQISCGFAARRRRRTTLRRIGPNLRTAGKAVLNPAQTVPYFYQWRNGPNFDDQKSLRAAVRDVTDLKRHCISSRRFAGPPARRASTDRGFFPGFIGPDGRWSCAPASAPGIRSCPSPPIMSV